MQENGKEFEDFITSSIGAHYLKNFEEEKIREKEKIDKKIDEMFNTGKGIILFGDVGVGKTMDLVYISKRIIERQVRPESRLIDTLSDEETIVYGELPIPVSYYFMPSLFDKLHFGERIKIKKFVLLDDWGREYAETFALSRFEILIEEIYANENSLVITTNLTKEQFINRDGWARATDRVREICSILEIPGKSMRHK
jgi:DNA replication protein DnaC